MTIEKILIDLINYIYALGTIAFISEYLIPKDKGEALALKLIDINHYLSTKNIDKLISHTSLYLSEKFDKVYGKMYFSKREWFISSIIAFTYCYIFYIAETEIGFTSTLFKQLGFWFIPNLIADIISINSTRWLLKKIYRNPQKYLKYLLYDFSIFIISFYVCFSFTIAYLFYISDYDTFRIIFHPIYLFSSGINNFPDPMAIDALFVILMASTTFIPTLIHLIFVSISVTAKALIPLLNFFVYNLIERMISFDQHPIGVAIITSGVFLLPFILLFKHMF